MKAVRFRFRGQGGIVREGGIRSKYAAINVDMKALRFITT